MIDSTPFSPLPAVRIDGSSLDHRQIATSARQPARVEVTADGSERVRHSWEYGTDVAGRRPLYGRATGVGSNRDVEVTGDQAGALRLLRSHATASGEERSDQRVRAMLLVRLNQLTAGGSGVHPAVVSGLCAMINEDALPVVRELGSLGTGDLSALAATALALIGEERTRRPLSSRTTFGAGDGLAFISSNAAALGDAAIAVDSLDESAGAALAIAALTFHAVDGNGEALSETALATTPFPGAAAAARNLRHLLDIDDNGVRRTHAGQAVPAARIQDPFALRTIPQTHGPVLDAVAMAGGIVDRLVNVPSENPVLLADPRQPGRGAVAHHGGFHQAYLQLGMDSLGLAVAQSGQLVLARLAALVEPAFTGLPPFLGDGTAGASGVMVTEYVAASALGSIRAAAQPAGTQSVTISRGAEEDASFASLATQQCLDIARLYRELLACELVAAVRAIRMRGDRPVTGRIGDLLGCCQGLPSEVADRNLSADLALAKELLPALADLARAVG